MNDIKHWVENGIGWIVLDRPEKHNALSPTMIAELHDLFVHWKDADEVLLICMEGAGDKAFCSGGDVKHLYDVREGNLEDVALDFFGTEYQLNMTMHTYKKPIVTYMNGIVMGGGVGLGVSGSHRIVTEKTKWAMPEMNIGLYPDVGGSYFLNQMPGEIGKYLALTSSAVRGEDALYCGAADYMIGHASWEKLKEALRGEMWSVLTAYQRLDALIEPFTIQKSAPSVLEENREKIDCHFSKSSMEAVIQSLDAEKEAGDQWCAQALKALERMSPTSLKVTLEQLIRGRGLDINACFEMELAMSMNFMQGHDFFEGVRAVLVDKDRNACWNPRTLAEVKVDAVDKYFDYDWSSDKNPLSGYLGD